MERVGVIGGGQMGAGIAEVAALAGCDVVVHEVSPEAAEAARSRIEKSLDRAVSRGKLDQEAAGSALSRITFSTDWSDQADRQIVIEAVTENEDLKKEIFRNLDEVVADADAILASNTSSIPITRLASATSRPDHVVGLHFFNPVHVMRLVEVVRGRSTAPEVVDAVVDFAVRIGKDPITVNDSPGFASSRLGVALGLEAMRMLEEGVASAADIDKAMELGYRHPMGPLRLTDLVGLDVRLDIARYLHEALGDERFRPPAILERLVAEGKLGKKTGQGFYSWEE